MRRKLTDDLARHQGGAPVTDDAAMSDQPLTPDYERVVARIRELVDQDEERRLLCASDPDCPCSYKDCYECGKWHNCRHTPWTAIREVLDTCPIPPGSDRGVS